MVININKQDLKVYLILALFAVFAVVIGYYLGYEKALETCPVCTGLR